MNVRLTQAWSTPTRVIHLGLATTVTLQLLLSLVMTPPGSDAITALGAAAFELHEGVGLTALALVLAHWAWTLWSDSDASLGHLFPWRGSARDQVVADLRGLLHWQLPPGGPQSGGLAGLAHGLGLLAVTGMSLSGGLLFVLLPESGSVGVPAAAVEDFHSALGSLVWVYWVGHVCLAVIHHLAGHDTLRDMFRLRAR